jgi:HD-GYP domain-containing protein (c-di-GMP phosphodiesterase class II)
MRRITIKEARPGMIAARSIAGSLPTGEKTPLAAARDTLTIGQLARCHELGIYDLWVSDPGLEFLEDLCVQPTRDHLRLAEGLRDSFLRLSCWVPRTLIKRHATSLEEVARALLRAAAALPFFRGFTEDDMLLAHSCDVAAVATLLGLQLETYLVGQRRRLNGRQAGSVTNLALGALLHDVGELMLPPAQRESRANDFDSETWKQHVAEGYAMVRGRIDPSAAGIVLQHHQRFDGTGFAGLSPNEGKPSEPVHRALCGESIHVYARIVMAADVFCQTLFAGARLPQPMVKTLWQLQQVPLRQAFDPVIHGQLMGLFAPFVEGMVVTLGDGRQAVVTKVDPACACYPEVRVVGDDFQTGGDPGPRDLKLAERHDPQIAVVDGVEVEKFLYGTTRAAPRQAA